MATKRRKAPEHFNEGSLRFIDPDYLSATLRRELRALIPRDADADKADAFMRACNFAAQNAFSWHGVEPAGKRAARLRDVESRCHALVSALQALQRDDVAEMNQVVDDMVNGWAAADLSEAMRGAVERLKPKDEGRQTVILGSGRTVVNPALNRLVDAAQDIEALAELAAASAKSRVSRTERPRIQAARVLAGNVVRAHLDAFGDLPPIGGDTRFHALVARLGEACGLSCGADMVNGVIRRYRGAAKRQTVG